MNGKHTAEKRDVFYIYERIETKKEKNREILREYGYEIRKYENAAAKSMNDRPFGVDFAEAQRRRARPKRSCAGSGRTQRVDGDVYIYRPRKIPGGAGGARVAAAEMKPLKLIIGKVINLFETIEERSQTDERIAKQRALMSKKWADNKHNFITAVILVLLTALVFTGVYKLFFVVKTLNAEGSDIYSANEIADATGIEIGENLYSFRASEAEAEVTFNCPYIKSAEVRRTVPKSVNVFVEDDEAKYSANIWGDTVELSAGLKVLGTTTPEEAREKGLTELILPPVQYSVAGRVLGFSDAKDEGLVRRVLAEAEESAAGQAGFIDSIDLSDGYNIQMKTNGLYTLKLGGEDDIGLKLRMMYKTVESGSLDKNSPATIDLTTVGEACVKYDIH